MPQNLKCLTLSCLANIPDPPIFERIRILGRKPPIFEDENNKYNVLKSVFRIHDILVWFGGSGCLWLMDPDSDPDPDPAIFVIDLQDASKKLFFNTIFSACYGTFWRYIYIIFKDKKSKRVTK